MMRRAMRSVVMAGAVIFAVSASGAGMNPFGVAGLPLNKQDYSAMAGAANPLLEDESATVGTSHDWSNPKSGNSGTVKLLKIYEDNIQGQTAPCRQLEYTVKVKGNGDPYNIILNRCKFAGSWKIN
jgi:surface antigen